jgi:hypothetical protein
MSFNFLQIYGTLITNYEYIDWEDNIVGDSVVEFFKVIRMVPVLLRYDSASLYWLFWSLGIAYYNYSLFYCVLDCYVF